MGAMTPEPHRADCAGGHSQLDFTRVGGPRSPRPGAGRGNLLPIAEYFLAFCSTPSREHDIIPAATGTAQSARTRLGIVGWPRGAQNCFLHPMLMSSSQIGRANV